MKKFIVLLSVTMLLSLQALAQITSSVVVFSQEGEKFYVIVNGIRQNDTPQTNVKVTGLTGPNYLFKVIFENESIPAIDKNVFTKDADNIYQDYNFVVKKDNKGAYVMRINSMSASTGVVTTEPAQYSAPLTLTATATNNNTVQTQTVTTTVDQNVVGDPNGASMNVNVVDPATGENVNMNMSVNMTVGGTQTQTTSTNVTTTTVTTTSNVQTSDPVVIHEDHYIMQGYNGPVGCPWPMTDNDFGAAQQTINSKSFESDKLTIAKQVLGSNCMTCDQIKWIMMTFSFEDSKLEFAKYAYGYVYDPGNFYRLNDAFTFSSSIDALNEYINGRR
jgi:hypothetical protein